MWGKQLLLFLLVLVVLPSCLALTVNPAEYTIKDPIPGKSYSITITIINTDSSLATLSAMLGSDSEYLSPYVAIEPKDAILVGPNEKENIRLTLDIPESISPEKHELSVNFFSLNMLLGTFRLFFEIPGDAESGLELEDMQVECQSTEEPVYFNFRLRNTGNVIVRPEPSLVIYDGERIVDSFGQESAIMVLPGESYNFSLLYDPVKLSEAISYAAEAKFLYEDRETATLREDFRLEMKQTKTKAGNEILNVQAGGVAHYTIKLSNPAGKISFYKVMYDIEGEGINDVVEGEFRENDPELDLEIDTSGLAPGDYILNIDIQSGIDLENTETRTVDLKVKEKWEYLQIVMIALGAGMLIGIFLARKIIISSLRKLTSTPSLGRIQSHIVKLEKNYDHVEAELRQLGKELNQFISSSNLWLEHHGHGRYGFR